MQHPEDGFVIKAIEQTDRSKVQSNVEFLEGGIGSKQATVSVSAPKGTEINSEFNFYGEKVNIFEQKNIPI